MAYSDPQAIVVDEVSIDLPRTGTSLREGTFTSADREYTLKVSHQSGSRLRHLARLEVGRVVSNPLVPDQNLNVSMSTHIVIDTPRNGFSAEDAVDIANALVDWATPSNIAKLVAFEN